MKRIKSACICQTVRFTPKERKDRTEAVEEMMKEVKDYKDMLQKSGAPYKISNEHVEPDGSVVISVVKKYGRYPIGKYLDF